MTNTPILSRLAFALAISAASLVAFAGEAVDSTEIEVVANGQSEKVRIENLKVGETRQIYSEAGTLVTATRLADSLQLDIAGDKTSIPMVEAGDLSEEELLALVGKEGAADGKQHVVRIHHADHAKGAAGEPGLRKVIMIDGKDGDLHALEGDGPHVIVKHGGEGKQVIVKRTLKKADEK